MKHFKVLFLILSFVALSGMVACAQKGQRTIKRPIFTVCNTTCLEITSITLSDTATVLNCHIKEYPHDWITITSACFLADEQGNKYGIRWAKGIEIDQSQQLPASGETDIELAFAPLPKKTKQIDFCESEHSKAWKIFDIRLDGAKKPDIAFAEPMKPRSPMIVDALPETTPQFGWGVLECEIVGYRPELGKFLYVSGTEAIDTGMDYFDMFEIDDTGHFTIKVQMECARHFGISILDHHIIDAIIEPNVTTHMRINLPELCRKRSTVLRDTEPYAQPVVSDSPWQTVLNEFPSDILTTLSDHEDYKSLANSKGYDELRALILENMQKRHDFVSQLKISKATRDILEFQAKVDAQMHLGQLHLYLLNNDASKKMSEEEVSNYRAELLKRRAADPVLKSLLSEANDSRYLPFFQGPIAVCSCDEETAKELPLLYEIRQALKMTNAIRLGQADNYDEWMATTGQQLPKAYIEYIEAKKQEADEKAANIRKQDGVNIGELGELKDNDLMAALSARYPDKVILVDFWATWCGPCKQAIKAMKTMKEELNNKDIVYVYITDESSPLTKWQEMTAEIPGEHFRFTDKQRKGICQKYEVKNLPTYFILNPNGKTVFHSVGFPGVEKMKAELQKALTK